jgi:phospho-N-acetylmuramoyl-pentapeptide-transferase
MYTLLFDYIANSTNNLIAVWSYITFRCGIAMGFSFIISMLFMPRFIAFISKIYEDGQPIRDNYLATHAIKKKTPTMGGVVILFSSLLGILFFADFKNPNVVLLVISMIAFALVGFLDDFCKLTTKKVDGITAKMKLLLQFLIAGFVVYIANLIYPDIFYNSFLTFPFLKDFALDLGLFYFIFRIIVIVGSSNAVNLTDGLDGLAIFPVILNLSTLMIFCYLIGNVKYASYLWLHHQSGLGEVCIVISAVIGGCFGFLWYNIKPAQIFMGDTGSLFLGGFLGSIAVISKNEILLGVIGGLFVVEALSVVIQVAVFKKTGRRFFKMAPIHHHFEKIGWSEMQVVVRFWLITILLCGIGILSLKFR